MYSGPPNTSILASSEGSFEHSAFDASTNSGDGRYPCLFQYAGDQKWRKLRRLLKRRKFQRMCTQRDSTGLSLLGIAVVSGAPIDIIDLILAIDPSQCQSTDAFGATPLHVACLNGASPQAVTYLMKLSNDLVRAKDIDSRVPLHHTVECICRDEISYDEGLEVITILCNADCYMIHAVDKHSDTPVDIVQIARLTTRPGVNADRLYKLYKFLRDISEKVFREKKLLWEEQGFEKEKKSLKISSEKSMGTASTASMAASAASSTNQSTVKSLYAPNTEDMQMDISVGSMSLN